MDAKELLGTFTSRETAEIAAALPDDVLKDEAVRRGLISQATGAIAVSERVEVPQGQDIKIDTSNIKESLFSQLGTAFTGYKTVAELINADRNKPEQFEVTDPETVEAEFNNWLTDEKAEYMARKQEADQELYWTLIATPNNMQVTVEEAKGLAVAFGKDQPGEKHTIGNLYHYRYSAARMSGTDPSNGNKIRFAAVPSKPTPELYGTTAAQRKILTHLQTDMPDLRVATFLDALVYWYTLRAGGDSLAHGNVFERTYNLHLLNLSEFEDDLPCFANVLVSCVNDYGEPLVVELSVRDDHYGRALVG